MLMGRGVCHGAGLEGRLRPGVQSGMVHSHVMECRKGFTFKAEMGFPPWNKK